MAKHFSVHAAIAVNEYASRGVTVRTYRDRGVQLLLHNGCGTGNMLAFLSPEKAIEVAVEMIAQARAIENEQQKAAARRLIEAAESGQLKPRIELSPS